MSSSSDAPAKRSAQTDNVRSIGKYELQRQLGAGGMGTVYLAKDTQLKRLVALKVLPHDKAKNPTLVRRFMAEAQASAQLRHENIVSIYENGEIDGHLFIAMEYVEGTDLHELIRKRGKIPIKRSLEIVKQVAKALEHAAAHNIVHRDIKPSNLLIRNDGSVKLTDLGLARSVDDTLETDITRAGTTVGTVDYMSPEQGRNSKAADIRSDLYSLGCTWYHMLTGKTPFPDGSMTNKLQAHAVKPPPNPQDLNDQVTEAMVAVLHRLMAKKPEDRYQTPAELLKDLSRPSMTRGGAAEEVFSAITEENSSEVAELPRAKRKSPPGVMPPKKTAQKAEDDKPGLDWETIRPIAFGVVIVLAVIALGVMFAGMGDTFNFGGGSGTAISKDNGRPKNDGSKLVQSPTIQGVAGNNTTPGVTTPDTMVVAGPNGLNPGDAGQAAPTSLDPSGGNQTVTSPSTQAQTPTALANNTRTFDPDAIPEWSTSPTSVASGSSDSTQSPVSPVGTAASKSANTSRFAIFTVGPGTPTKTHFRSLGEALNSAPRDGASITLSGPGPFVVPEISLRQIQRIVLQAASGPRPILLVRPAEGQATAGLTLAEGLLELDGLDLVLDRAAFAGSDPVRMIASVDGQLMVRNSSFTVWGAGTVPVRAMEVNSELEPQGLAPTLEPRVGLERVFVRGDNVTALAIARPNADVVVRDSLFVGGEEPVLSVSGTLPEALASAGGERPRRAIRIVGSTIVARKLAIWTTAGEATVPPTTTINFQDSVAAAATGESQFLDASTWPSAGPDAEGGKLMNLTFQLKDSLVVKFAQLANLGPNSAFQAREPGDWLTLWKREVDTQQFATVAWPAELPGDLSLVAGSALSPDSLPAGSAIGCDVKQLYELSSASRRWLTAVSNHPLPPVSSFAAAPAQVVKFDASKGDFGAFLQKGDWPAGTVIEVTGSGLRPMSPVKLVGKSWKIVCQQQADAQLTFSPKSVSSDLTALIFLEGGDLELQNVRLQLTAGKKSSLASLIAGHGGKLTLNNVSLQGVWSDADALDSLLAWTAGESPASLVLRDSLFTNGGNALRLDLGPNHAFIENCLLVSRKHTLDLRPGSLPAGAPAGALVAERVTFSAVQGAIHVQSSASGVGLNPHRLFVDRCVFAPPQPSRGDEGAATVLRLADPATDLTRIEWWGTANGVAPGVKSFVRGDAEPPSESSDVALQRWQETWPAEQDERLLTGAGGVVLKPDANSKAGQIKPAQFALDPNAKAHSWANNGTAIGADIRRIDIATAVAAKTKDAGKVQPKRTNLPNTF